MVCFDVRLRFLNWVGREKSFFSSRESLKICGIITQIICWVPIPGGTAHRRLLVYSVAGQFKILDRNMWDIFWNAKRNNINVSKWENTRGHLMTLHYKKRRQQVI